MVFTASLLDVQQLEGQCEACIVCGRQVEGGSLTRRPKGPKATWRKKMQCKSNRLPTTRLGLSIISVGDIVLPSAQPSEKFISFGITWRVR